MIYMYDLSVSPQLGGHPHASFAFDVIHNVHNVTGQGVPVSSALSVDSSAFSSGEDESLLVDADEVYDPFQPSTTTDAHLSVAWATSTATITDVSGSSPWRASTAGILLCLVIVFTLTGNSLVVIAVASTKRLRSSVTNYFVVSLAVADLTVAVLVMPYAVLYELHGSWTFGWIFCYFWISCDVTCCTASILHLCVVAADRYLAVTEPLTYRSRMSKRRALCAIAGVWTCSSAISFVPIYAGWFVDDSVTTPAIDDTAVITGNVDDAAIFGPPTMPLFEDGPVCGLHVNRTYAVVSSATSFYLPLIVMVVLYAKIFRIARKQSIEIRKLESAVVQQRLQQPNASSSTSSTGGVNGRRLQRQSRRVTGDTKAIKTLGTLMSLFIVSWLPFFVVYLVKPFCSGRCTVNPNIETAVTWLGYCNSFINPVVYAFLNRDFRSAFRRVILCGRVPPPPYDADNVVSTFTARRRTPAMTSCRMTQNGRGVEGGFATFCNHDGSTEPMTSVASVNVKLKIVQFPVQTKCFSTATTPPFIIGVDSSDSRGGAGDDVTEQESEKP